MPGSTEILEGLSTIAQSWRSLALFWHVYFALLAIAVLIGWRPMNRSAGALLIPPLASVSVLAWLEGNPFNGTCFGFLAIVLVALLRMLPATPVRLGSAPWLVISLLLFAFGWIYPHFLEASPSFMYLYAAPLGLVPCPTLSMVVGSLMAFRGLGSRAWTGVLTVAAAFYGVFGSVYLGVIIDWVLTAGAAGLLALSFNVHKTAAAAHP